MPFNKDITGYRNEEEFARYLNNRAVSHLNPIFSDLINTLFENIQDDDVVKSSVSYNKQKTDIFIEIANQVKRISIKKGVKNSVHVEEVSTFIVFLHEHNIPQKIINNILKYHYADGTLDGSGENRLSITEYKENHQKEIDEVNEYLEDENLIKDVVDRFILIGNNSTMPIDAIIYGVVDDFIWITKEEIRSILISKRKNYSTGIHFSSLSYQPLTRCLNRNPVYEIKRRYIQIKWYNISDDIIEVMCQRSR